MLAIGIPRVGLVRTRLALTPLVASLALLSVCALTIAPGSEQRVGTGLRASGGPPGRRSLVLIVLDTLRRDHMSLYGYARRTTPHLDRWAEGALVFDDSSAASSWTLPAHASIFTGLFPRSHAWRIINRSPEPDSYIWAFSFLYRS